MCEKALFNIYHRALFLRIPDWSSSAASTATPPPPPPSSSLRPPNSSCEGASTRKRTTPRSRAAAKEGGLEATGRARATRRTKKRNGFLPPSLCSGRPRRARGRLWRSVSAPRGGGGGGRGGGRRRRRGGTGRRAEMGSCWTIPSLYVVWRGGVKREPLVWNGIRKKGVKDLLDWCIRVLFLD